jgi:hypothetical protein
VTGSAGPMQQLTCVAHSDAWLWLQGASGGLKSSILNEVGYPHCAMCYDIWHAQRVRSPRSSQIYG